MAHLAARRNIDRPFDLRIAAREVEQQIIAINGHLQGDAAGIALGHVLVHIVVEDIFTVRQLAQNGAGLAFGIVQQIGGALLESLDAEFGDHLVHAALARGHGRDLRFQITPVLFRHAYVGQHDGENVIIDHALFQNLGGRYADAFLMHLGQSPRQAGRHRAAHVRIVDMTDHETDDLALMKDRLPDMHIR